MIKLKIRLATKEDIKGLAKVHVDSWRTTYEGIVDPDFLRNLSYEEREKMWTGAIDTNPPLVAIDEAGEVLGFASGGAERSGDYPGFDAELYAIYILKEYQGLGLGRRLMNRLIDRLIEEGFESMIVIVLAENEAKYFYEAMGGKRLAEASLTIGSRTHQEIVYGWESLQELKK